MKKYLTDIEDEMERVKSELEMLRNLQFDSDGMIATSTEMKKYFNSPCKWLKLMSMCSLLGETGVGKHILLNSFIKKFS